MKILQSLLPSDLKNRTNAFTIVELLVVIGIISVLAVALLVTLNPAEAQRKARDSQRVKDANTIQAILESYLNEVGNLTNCAIGTPCLSTTVTGSAAGPCSSSWLGTLNVCNYARSVPVDPSNGLARTCMTRTPTTGAANVATACTAKYVVAFAAGNYEIGVIQESAGNDRKPYADGGAITGNETYFIQIYSSTAPLGVTYTL